MLNTLAIPFELVELYATIADIFQALPLVARLALTSCFWLACLFAIVKLLL